MGQGCVRGGVWKMRALPGEGGQSRRTLHRKCNCCIRGDATGNVVCVCVCAWLFSRQIYLHAGVEIGRPRWEKMVWKIVKIDDFFSNNFLLIKVKFHEIYENYRYFSHRARPSSSGDALSRSGSIICQSGLSKRRGKLGGKPSLPGKRWGGGVETGPRRNNVNFPIYTPDKRLENE